MRIHGGRRWTIDRVGELFGAAHGRDDGDF
jgi:hypothetical protein